MTHRGRTLAERILSEASGRPASPGEVVVCEPDLVLGTDGSAPMAIDYFEAMNNGPVARPDRVLLARDHYAPPTTAPTLAFHARMEDFAARHGVELLEVGDGISFLVALETERVRPGDLVIGGDSHTVTCGALGAFATGVGSSDLAAAFKTGQVWLRVPETVRVVLDGAARPGVTARDVGLELVARLAGELPPFSAIEFAGEGVDELSLAERVVLANLSAEMGAMAGIFPAPGEASPPGAAGVIATIPLDMSALEPAVALPHDPAARVPLSAALGRPIDWVFIGTCAAGGPDAYREALRVIEAGGGIAEGVTVVVTPPTARVRHLLATDGTLARLEAAGAIVTEAGCGACCGTSGPLPHEGARVISTANRNFRGRMGHASIEITLAGAAVCGAAAVTGAIADPGRWT